jgi:hypothetical protein
MAKATASNLLISGFAAAKQKGPKSAGFKRGEKPESETIQQHGELANADEPVAVKTDKPKQMSHSGKAMLPRFGGMGEASKKTSPRDEVLRAAHETKVSATRSWMDGHISTKEHDARHRRANAVLKHKALRP